MSEIVYFDFHSLINLFIGNVVLRNFIYVNIQDIRVLESIVDQ